MALIPNNRAQKAASDGRRVIETTDVSSILRGIVWKSFAVTYPSTTQEVYTFYANNDKTDALVTVTLNYTDATKEDLLDGFLTKL